MLDAAGRRRSPATLPGQHRARPPRNKACATPPTRRASRRSSPSCDVAGDRPHGLRTRALVVLLWRAGLRSSEALALAQSDLDVARGGVLVRQGKGGKRREVGMDRWGWQHLEPCWNTGFSCPSARCSA